MNARPLAAWSATCIFVVLSTTNHVYKAMVLAAALSALAAGAGLRRIRGLLFGVLLISAFAMLLNFVSAHLATTLARLRARLSFEGRWLGTMTFNQLRQLCMSLPQPPVRLG